MSKLSIVLLLLVLIQMTVSFSSVKKEEELLVYVSKANEKQEPMQKKVVKNLEDKRDIKMLMLLFRHGARTVGHKSFISK